MTAECETVEEIEPVASPEMEALQRNVVSQFQQIVTSSPTLSDDLQTIAINIEEPGRLADFIASSLPFLTTIDKQELLETPDVSARLERINKHLAKELEVQQLRNKIQTEVQDSVQSSQRDYYLREQLKAIQKELGDLDDTQKDIAELKEKIEAAGMPEEIKKDALKELGRLSRMNAMAADYSLTRNYIEWLAVLPWSKSSAGEVDILRAKEILDEDHYGLKKVKDRILDYLSVRRLKPDMKGPILCFVGPPGVGKTSLGRSVAKALGRKFSRISLGGMHDEAELRGHRRTYIGALPGQVIQNLKRVETNDPVFMLDEIDKLGRDFRGDPASALLEVLDPEQNNTFRDNYLDQPFDLSKVLFICTANQLDPMPGSVARPHGDHRANWLHGGREGCDCNQVPDPAADQGERYRPGVDRVPAGEHRVGCAALHAGGWCSQTGTADWNDLPQTGAPHRRREAGQARDNARGNSRVPRRHQGASRYGDC